jgi:molybdate transport system ATP-binding protein
MNASLHLDIEIQRGDRIIVATAQLDELSTGLLGPSGSGKTSLLHAIAGLVKPRRGRIQIGNDVLFDSDHGINLPAAERRVGVVFQDGRLFPHWSVSRNITAGAVSSSHDSAFEKEIIELLELADLLDRKPETLSGGEQQRVALARAIIMRPRWLLLDEPLSAIDSRLKNRILPFLRKVRDHCEIPILHVSHDAFELMAISDVMLHLAGDQLTGPTSYRDLLLNTSPGEIDAMNLLPARVHRIEGGECHLACGELELLSAAVDHQPGDLVTVRIAPSEIAISTGELGDISIRNRIRGSVKQVHSWGDSCLVEIDSKALLLAQCTAESCRTLKLKAGCEVTILIKASAVHTIADR